MNIIEAIHDKKLFLPWFEGVGGGNWPGWFI